MLSLEQKETEYMCASYMSGLLSAQHIFATAALHISMNGNLKNNSSSASHAQRHRKQNAEMEYEVCGVSDMTGPWMKEK